MDERSNQEKWEAILAQLPGDLRNNPGKVLEAFRTHEAKARELQPYRDWYTDYLRWKQTFDEASYEAYMASREPVQPIAPVAEEPPLLPSLQGQEIATTFEISRDNITGEDVADNATTVAAEPIEAPSPLTLPAEDAVWDWGDLVEDDAPDEAEDVIVPAVEDEEPVSGDVPPAVEEMPPTVKQLNKEDSSDANGDRDANKRHGVSRSYIRRISAWFWGR
jgi:hypothetical protein